MSTVEPLTPDRLSDTSAYGSAVMESPLPVVPTSNRPALSTASAEGYLPSRPGINVHDSPSVEANTPRSVAAITRPCATSRSATVEGASPLGFHGPVGAAA